MTPALNHDGHGISIDLQPLSLVPTSLAARCKFDASLMVVGSEAEIVSVIRSGTYRLATHEPRVFKKGLP